MNTHSHEKLKVLVVDDDELNRRMMRLILTREEHQVETAANGFEALTAAKAQEFDIILMDLQMPEMDGIEASKQIRASENGGRLAYIVALTASYLPEKGHELYQAGIDNYIAKPFDVMHLRQMLEHGLDHRRKREGHKNNGSEQFAVNESQLDITLGIKRVGGDEETYQDLLADYVHQLPGKIQSMEKYMIEKNVDELSRIAHNMKGVSASLGVLQLSEYAGRLEKQALEGYTTLLEDIFKNIVSISHKFTEDASNYLAKSGN